MKKITALTVLLSSCVINSNPETNIPEDSSVVPIWRTQDGSSKTAKDGQPSDTLNENAITIEHDSDSEGIGETSSPDLPDGSFDAIEESAEKNQDASSEGSAQDDNPDVESETSIEDASQDSNDPETSYDASEDIAETSPLEADGAIASETSVVGCNRGCALQGHYACWPMREHPTFNVVVNDFVVQDRCTGLYWESNITSNSSYYVFDDALRECTGRGLPIPQGIVAQWRLATRIELASILDYDLGNPVLNTNVFAPTLDQYWTSSQTDTGLAWTITMHQGAIAAKPKTTAYYARCVLDPLGDTYQSNTLNHYDQSVDGEVRDLATLLTWEAWDTQNSAARTLADATTYCQTKGNGWRLPSLKELLTLGNDNNIVDPTLFPNLIPGNYWTSTMVYNGNGKRWTLHFGTGITSATEATAYVRCVH